MTSYSQTIEEVAPGRLVIRLWHPATLIYFASGAYTLAFPFVPDVVRYVAAGAIGLVVIVAAAFPGISGETLKVDLRKVYLLVMTVATVIAYLVIMTDRTGFPDYASIMVRSLTAVAAIIFFSSADVTLSARAAIFVYAAIAASACILTGMHGLYDYAGILRPYPFTGLDGIHSSAYAVLAAFLGTVILRMQGAIGRRGTILLGGPLLGLLLAYQVRTTWMMAAAFALVVCFAQARRRIDPRLFAAIVGISVALIALLLPLVLTFALPGFDLGVLSSGRTDVYVERLGILADRPLPQLLFGTGLGTDNFASSTWWWEQKDSHNDFLHVVIEQGAVGFVSLVLILGATLRRANVLQAAVVVALVSGALLSNALLERPLLAVLFLGTMAFAKVSRNREG